MLRGSKKLFFAIMVLSFVVGSVCENYAAAPRQIMHQFKSDCIPRRVLQISAINGRDLDYYKGLVILAAKNNFNTIMLDASGFVNFPDVPLDIQPMLTPADLAELDRFIRAQGLELIPQINLLSHQDMVAKRYKQDILLNERTLDPKNPKSWKFEKRLIDNLIAIHKPKIINISHDETLLYGNKRIEAKFVSKGWKLLTADEYFDHLMKVYAYLKEKGIQTIIWGDMFITPDLSAGFYRSNDVAATPGYNGNKETVKLIDKLPKDIIIGDWHYEDRAKEYPSMDFFQNKGFQVWGATWFGIGNIRNFSRYAREHAIDDTGMVLTLWHYSWNNEKYHSDAEAAIIEAGKAFCPQLPSK